MEYEGNDRSTKTLYPFTKTGSHPDIDCAAKWYSGYIINCIFIMCDKYMYENSLFFRMKFQICIACFNYYSSLSYSGLKEKNSNICHLTITTLWLYMGKKMEHSFHVITSCISLYCNDMISEKSNKIIQSLVLYIYDNEA